MMTFAEPRQKLLIVLTVAGCLSAAVQLPPTELLMMGGGVEPTNVALRLAQDWTLADPYSAFPTGPTAHVSPLFPIYLATLMTAFGQTPLLEFLIVILLFIVHSAYPVLLWLAGWRVAGSEAAGIAAAAFAILLPTFPMLSQWNYIYTADLLLIMCVATSGWANERWSGWKRPVLAGAVTGLLSLWDASSVLIVGLWWLYLYLRANGARAGIMGAAVLSVASFGLTVAPWAVRNYAVLGAPIFLRDNLGLELAVSNNDLVQPTQHQNLTNGSYDQLHPNRNREQAMEVVCDGEVNHNRKKFGEAVDWILSHPRQFAELTVARIRYFWFPYPGEYAGYSYRTWPLTALSLLGVVQLIRMRQRFAWFVIAVLIVYPAVFYLVHASIRLRLPMIWIEVLMAGYALAHFAGRVGPIASLLAKYTGADGAASAATSAG